MTHGRRNGIPLWHRATGQWGIVLTAALLACSEPVGRGWDWGRMRRQPRYIPYGSSAFFSDGKAMRTPPAGTVLNDSPGIETVVLSSPIAGGKGAAPSSTILALGATRFHVVCAACHGARGDGNSVVAMNMPSPKPPSLLVPPVRALSPEQLLAVITDGFGRMPPFAAVLSPAERRAVVTYVLVLQGRGDGTQAVGTLEGANAANGADDR